MVAKGFSESLVHLHMASHSRRRQQSLCSLLCKHQIALFWTLRTRVYQNYITKCKQRRSVLQNMELTFYTNISVCVRARVAFVNKTRQVRKCKHGVSTLVHSLHTHPASWRKSTLLQNRVGHKMSFLGALTKVNKRDIWRPRPCAHNLVISNETLCGIFIKFGTRVRYAFIQRVCRENRWSDIYTLLRDVN